MTLYILNLLFLFTGDENMVVSSSGVDALLSQLAKEGPLVALFLLVIIGLVYQLNKREKEIVKLNEYIRETNKDNMNVLNEVTNTLDKVVDKQRDTNDILTKEINNLKEFIILKLNSN